MAITIADLQLGALPSGLLEKTRVESSAFLSLGTQIPDLPLQGTTIDGVGDIESYIVKEGGQKIMSGAQTVTHIRPWKFVAGTILTEEAFITAAHIRDAITRKQPEAHARKLDALELGLVEATGDFANFPTLADAQVVEISEGVDAGVDWDDALAAIRNGNADGAVLTTGMEAYLRRQRIGATGARVFDIQKTPGSNSGTIEGIPYRTVTSTVKKGVIGDFSNFYWGTHELGDEFAHKIKDAGNITDNNGVVHNLTDSNKVALVNEIYMGVAYTNIANYVMIVPATAA